jgi:hypothetical protein
MSDTTESNPYRSAADRAREDRRLFPLRGQTWETGMQAARDMRKARAAAAAHHAIGLAAELALTEPAPETRGDPMWEVRGELRTRETFGRPHPADFPGGLPLPRDRP